MTGLLWRLTRAETMDALVLGALAVRARQRIAKIGPQAVRPHPIADLSGQRVDVIADEALRSCLAAHAGDEPELGEHCASCEATIELASHYGDPTHKLWPDPVRRRMADVLDEELARRKTAAP